LKPLGIGPVFKTDDDVTSIAHQDDAPLGMVSPPLGPEIKDVMEVDVRQQGEATPPCGVPSSGRVTSPSSITPAFGHLRIKRITRRSPTRCLDKTDQPLVVARIEEPGNIGVQYPVHSRVADPDRECVQCIMWTAFGPEPIREPEEIFLIDRVQHLNHRTLDDLVFQRGDAERALPTVRFWSVIPA
jgi:hypothetical protein